MIEVLGLFVELVVWVLGGLMDILTTVVIWEAMEALWRWLGWRGLLFVGALVGGVVWVVQHLPV